MIFVIVLTLAVAASMTALFLRGFKISDLVKDESKVTTPSMTVWLVKTDGYDSKMAAYKAGANQTTGFATYVYEENDQWTLVEGVYLTDTEANTLLQNPQLPEKTVSSKYDIVGKEFKLDTALAKTCNAVLDTIKQTFNKLLEMRNLFTEGHDLKNAVLALTDYYNLLKNYATALQEKNIDAKSTLVATIIYAANQNILGLHEVIFGNSNGNAYLSLINTALTKSIFSLDNF